MKTNSSLLKELSIEPNFYFVPSKKHLDEICSITRQIKKTSNTCSCLDDTIIDDSIIKEVDDKLNKAKTIFSKILLTISPRIVNIISVYEGDLKNIKRSLFVPENKKDSILWDVLNEALNCMDNIYKFYSNITSKISRSGGGVLSSLNQFNDSYYKLLQIKQNVL